MTLVLTGAQHHFGKVNTLIVWGRLVRTSEVRTLQLVGALGLVRTLRL